MASKIFSTAAALVDKKSGKKQQQQNKKPEQPMPQPQPLKPTEPTESLDVKKTDIVKPVEDNPVGRLQELCQHRLWPLPSYTFECSNVDNPSKRQFTCTVKLQGHTDRGVGRSKQLAKRACAQAMLQQLAACTEANCCQSALAEIKKSTAGDGNNKKKAAAAASAQQKPATPPPSPLDEAAFQELRSSKRLQSAARAGAEVNGLFRGVRNRKAGATLPPLETPTAGPSSASDQLMELSKQHRFGVQFLDNGSDNSSGQYRAVVKLSTMPTIVAVSNGASVANAKEQACRAAIEYLCSLTRESTGPAGKKA
uniref:TARBP2 n=2 Tax=Macrostomum lignano TaxID=282301 RepID=A0A0M4HHD3_9PLAT|nr:TARBP2 [Macrostomum lignano]